MTCPPLTKQTNNNIRHKNLHNYQNIRQTQINISDFPTLFTQSQDQQAHHNNKTHTKSTLSP